MKGNALFGWIRQRLHKAREADDDIVIAAAADARLMFTTIEAALEGTPTALADDPFVIGAVACHAASMTAQLLGRTPPHSLVEAAMVRALHSSLGHAGLGRWSAKRALHRFNDHPDFARAKSAVETVLGARFRHEGLANAPLFIQAWTRLQALPPVIRISLGLTGPEQVATLLARDLLVAPCRARYGLHRQPPHAPVPASGTATGIRTP